MIYYDEMTAAQRIEFYHERKLNHDIDGRPRVSDTTSFRGESDPLLEALYRVHKRPRCDLFPGKRN